MRKCAEKRLNKSKKRSISIGLNFQSIKNGIKILRIGLKYQHPRKRRNRKSIVQKQRKKKEKKPLVRIKIIFTEGKTGNVLYAVQKIIVNITTAPDVKEFILKTDHTK